MPVSDLLGLSPRDITERIQLVSELIDRDWRGCDDRERAADLHILVLAFHKWYLKEGKNWASQSKL